MCVDLHMLHVCVVCRQDVFVGYCDIKESAVLSEWSHDYIFANSDVSSLLQIGFHKPKRFSTNNARACVWNAYDVRHRS